MNLNISQNISNYKLFLVLHVIYNYDYSYRIHFDFQPIKFLTYHRLSTTLIFLFVLIWYNFFHYSVLCVLMFVQLLPSPRALLKPSRINVLRLQGAVHVPKVNEVLTFRPCRTGLGKALIVVYEYTTKQFCSNCLNKKINSQWTMALGEN